MFKSFFTLDIQIWQYHFRHKNLNYINSFFFTFFSKSQKLYRGECLETCEKSSIELMTWNQSTRKFKMICEWFLVIIVKSNLKLSFITSYRYQITFHKIMVLIKYALCNNSCDFLWHFIFLSCCFESWWNLFWILLNTCTTGPKVFKKNMTFFLTSLSGVW